MGAIDVGSAAIDRAGTLNASSDLTYISLANPANASGIITNLQVYINAALDADDKFGIFFLVSGTTYQCRSVHILTGALNTGLQNISCSLEVITGDILGIKMKTGSTGKIEKDTSVGAGTNCRYYSGDKCIVGQSASYSDDGEKAISLYGTGVTLAAKGSVIQKLIAIGMLK